MRPVSVYAEITPNPATMKYVADIFLADDNTSFEFKSPDEVKEAPLLERIFRFPFVESVFLTKNFISITKNDLIEWEDVTGELREYIQDYLRKNDRIFYGEVVQKNSVTDSVVTPEEVVVPQNETEQKIVDILEEYVRPAVEQDGGNIIFKSFQDGILKVTLKGSCSGCPSSSITLKSGIQSLFERMMPEVKEVVADEG